MTRNTEDLRARIASAKAAIAQIEAAPADEETIRRSVAELIGRKAGAFEGTVDLWAGVIAKNPAKASEILTPVGDDFGRWSAEALLCLLAPAIEKAIVDAALLKASELGGGIEPARRREKLEKVRRELYLLEVEDCKTSHAAGIPCRPDSNPAAWLGVPYEDALAANLV